MEIKENKKELLPSERPREELELAVAEYEKKHPDTFTFGILEEGKCVGASWKYYYIPCVVIYKVHDCEEVEIPDFVREFRTSHLSYTRENEDSQCFFTENLKKIKGGQGLCSLDHMFENANFIHTVDVSQLCVKNVSSMFATFSHCKAKGLKGLSAWTFGELPTAYSMFHSAEIEVLEDMFPLAPFFQADKCFRMFFDAKIAEISDLSSWDTALTFCEGLVKENLMKLIYNNAIIPDLGFDNNEKKKADKAKEFYKTSTFLLEKGEFSLETTIKYCYLLETMSEGKTASTIEEWFEVYLQDPWEMTFTNEVFEDLVEVYHKNNPKLFEYEKDEEGHIRIKRFSVDNWKKSEFYQTHTIVIPDFVYGFAGSPFGAQKGQEDLRCIYKGVLIFRLGKNVRDLSRMFDSSHIAPKLMLEDWDTSKVTRMDRMFGRSHFSQIWGLEKFDTSHVTSMKSLFDNCWRSNFDLSKGFESWDTSSVVNMASMFRRTEIMELNLNGWDVSNVENMASMFANSTNLKKLTIDEWKPKNVKTLTDTFCSCTELKHLNLRGWDLRNVKRMDSVFKGCESLETLDFSGWQLPTEGKVDGRSIFEGCKSLKTLDLTSWNFSCFTRMDSCFQDCVNLSISNGDEEIASWDISNLEDMSYIFKNCGITLKDPKKVREIWMSKQHPSCDVAREFHDRIYGKKTIVKEMEINDFMPDLGLHYEICKWDEKADSK